MEKNICTIIAKNYIAYARTMCASYLDHNPLGKCYVLIIDDYKGYIDPIAEKFEILDINLLSVPDLIQFCYKYNITELSTAFKPFLLKYLFDKFQMEKILYIDPDIFVFQSLNNLFLELEDSSIIITPHLDKDFPDDEKKPDDKGIMLCGIYNLGFIGLKNNEISNRFLLWWQHKLYNKCVIEPHTGFFVDQKFMDLALGLFQDIKIIYDTGYNVAYWNLHSRKVWKKNNVWMCNNGLLYFYHFSNYKPEKADLLSGYQNRFTLKDFPDLQDLFSFYSTFLKKNGYDFASKWPYGYASYTNGKKIRYIDRKCFRKNIPKYNIENPFVLESHPLSLKIVIFFSRIKLITMALSKNIVQLIS